MTETPPPSDGGSPDSTGVPGDLELWQTTLAAEHAVIWGYGLVGSTPGLATQAQLSLRQHRDRRTVCVEAVTAIGADPVASEPAYELARPSNDTEARRQAAELEARTNAAYAALAGADAGATRLLAAQWLREGAIAQTRWSGEIPPLPGFNG